jgi:hypothetical protein
MNCLRTLAMIGFAASLATVPAAGHSDLLIDEDVQISPSKVRPLEFDVGVQGTRVLCTYHVEQGRSGVRAVLLKRGDVRLWLSDRPHSVLASTGYAESGEFSSLVEEPGAYSIVLDNRLEGRDSATVRLQVKLVSGPGLDMPVQRADSTRAQIAVWVSVLLFALFALLSGWRIHLALESRRRRRAIPFWTRSSY